MENKIYRNHILTANMKGGAGKSTITTLLYSILSKKKNSPDTIVTFDTYSNLPELLNNEEEDIYIAIKPDKEERFEWIDEISKSKDTVYMVDTPGYHMEGQDVLYKSSRKILVPLKISDLDIQATIDLLSYLEGMNYPFEDIMIIINDFQPNEKLLAEEAYQEISDVFKYDFNHIYIRHFKILVKLTKLNKKISKKENQEEYVEMMKDFDKMILKDRRYSKGIYPIDKSLKTLIEFCKTKRNDKIKIWEEK